MNFHKLRKSSHFTSHTATELKYLKMDIKDVANNISIHMKQHKEEAQSIISPNLKRAAVLVPIFELEEKLFVILTKRSDSLSSHKGDVCFPGGKQDADDADITATALREAFEEIGLHPSQVEVLGEMYPFVTYNQLVVTPIIGFIRNHEDLTLIRNENEVDDIFACPLDFFLKKLNHHFISSKLHPNLKIHSFAYDVKSHIPAHSDSPFSVQVFHPVYNNHVIYGLTASIVVLVAMVSLNKRCEFEENSPHMDEDGFVLDQNLINQRWLTLNFQPLKNKL